MTIVRQKGMRISERRHTGRSLCYSGPHAPSRSCVTLTSIPPRVSPASSSTPHIPWSFCLHPWFTATWHAHLWAIFGSTSGFGVDLLSRLMSRPYKEPLSAGTVAEQPPVFATELWKYSVRPTPALHHPNYQSHVCSLGDPPLLQITKARRAVIGRLEFQLWNYQEDKREKINNSRGKHNKGLKNWM